MEITVDGGTRAPSLYGEFDMSATFTVEPALERVLEEPGLRRLTVDLSRLSFIDSTGIGVLLRVQQESAARGIELVLVPGPDQVQRVFETAGLPARCRSCREPDASVGGRRLGLGQPGQRRVVLVQVGRRAERLVVDLRLAVVGGRRLVRHVGVLRGDRRLAHAAAPTRSSAGAPHACRTSGTATLPSSRWPFSSRAIRVRPTATAVPFSVAT